MSTPTFSSAATNTSGTEVVLTYDEALSSTTAATTAFTVRTGGITNNVNGVEISGSTVELTVENVIRQGQAVHVSYVDPSSENDPNAVQDAAGNDAITLKTVAVNNQSTIASDTALEFNIQQIGSDLDGRRNGASSGESVSLSENGQRVAIGSQGDRTIDKGRGSVRVYEQIGSGWQQLGDDIDGEAKGDNFGSEVSLSADGSRLAVGGARNDVAGTKIDAGHVQIYQLVNNDWTQLGDDIDGENANDRSGDAVQISGDGGTVIIGGSLNNTQGHAKVYNYNEEASQWMELGQEINGEQENEYLGSSVDISDDGTVIAVGSVGFDPTINGKKQSGRGRVQIYELISNQWGLKGSSIFGEGNNDNSGRSISLSADGNTIAIGANGNDGVKNKNGGHVRVYTFSSNQWTKVGQDIDGQNRGDGFGWSVKLSSNGERLAVAAPRYEPSGKDRTGQAKIYELKNNQWVELGNVSGEASLDDAGHPTQGGTGISMSGNGQRFALGARKNDGASTNAGHTRVYDINNNGPSLSAYTPSIAEDRASGSSIFNLNDSNTGTDYDPDGNALSYSITAGNDAGLFAIDPDSGLISIAPGKTLDFETTSSHPLTIQASDGEVATTAAITINVSNINDNNPVIANANPTLAENAAAGSLVLNLNDSNTGTDNDPDGNALSYSITAGNDAGLFSINTTSGVVSIAAGKALDFETATSHSLTVQASDGTNTDNATVTISVSNINDNAPVIANTNPTLAENAAAGSLVLNLNDSNTGTDNDPDGNALSYSITAGNDAGLFSINTTSGVVSIAAGKALDFETATSHSLTVQASDGTNTDNATVTISVSNINDNAPVIANANPTLAENAAAGSLVLNLNDSNTGTDNDPDGNALSYSITAGNDAGLFSINTTSGVVSIAAGKALDFETATSHSLTVQASDGTNTDNATVTISVSNINDNAPVIANSSTSVDEDAPAGTNIININDSTTGNDTDADGNTINYSITGGNVGGIFAINGASGVITIAGGKALDYSTASSHALNILATDGTYTDTATIQVDVGNTDANAPSIDNSNPSVAENAAAGITIIDINDSNTGNDSDNDGDALSYSITTGNDAGLFSINTTSGVVSIAAGKALDFETATSHSLTVQASDGTNTDNATVTISVSNINDNAPVIANANPTLAENAAAGSLVLNLNDSNTGTDNDPDGNALSYSITAGNDAGLFSINTTSGVVSIAAGKALDFETATSHSLTVQASDGTNTDNATVTISVSNINDNNPVIANANPTLAENAAAGSLVLNLNDSNTGTDNDPDGNALSYSITAGNDAGLFSINTTSGVVSIAAGKALDFETATSHSLTVQASDGTNTDNATVTISVSNINDNNPVIANANPTLAENAAAGSLVLNLNDSNTGTDNDPDGNALSYSITAGNDAGLFSINTTSGVVSIAAGKALDFETATSHSLTVQASDGTNTDNATVTISVSNINDNNPVIANANPTLAENAAAGSLVLNLNDSNTGTDNDPDGNALSYSITAGNDAGLFSINTTSGVVSIAAGKALDFETATSHSLTVQASDGTNTDNATVTISVSNINDNNPTVADEVVEILETITPGTEITDLKDNLTTNDNDRDGDAISYSITSGNNEALFTIAAATGKITLAAEKSLDFETRDQHVLQINATDGTNVDTAQITIDVLDSNTAPRASDDNGTLNENTTLSRTAENGIVQSNDTDAQGDSLIISQFQTGSITNPSGVFGSYGVPLDGEYGQLTLQANGSFSYVANRAAADELAAGESVIDTFTYIISDGKLTDTAEINFTINGINDAPDLVDAIKTKKYTEGQSNVTIIDGSLTIRDIDDTNIESASVAITSAFQTTEDTLAFTNNFGITGAWNQGTGVLSLTGSTTKTNYERALQTVTYTNTDNANPVLGLRTITWSINDGETNSSAITSQVDVGGVNDSPEADNEEVALNAGSSVSTTTGQASLLANDTDPEGNALNIHTFRLGKEQDSNPDFAAGGTITGLYGQLTIEANGTYTYNTNQSASQRLLTGEARTETFNYTIHDTSDAEDLGEITFTLTGINDKPTATDDTKQINENNNKFFSNVQGLLINDTDLDGDQLEITKIRTGLETDTSTNDNATGTSVQGTYGSLILEVDGSYRYDANHSNADALDAGDIEADVFTYTLSDSQLEDKAEIRINVKGVNDAPVLSAVTSGSIADQANSNTLTSSNLTGQLEAKDADASASLSYGVSSVNTAGSARNNFQARHAFQSINTGQYKNAMQRNSATSMSGTYGQLNIDSNTGAYTYTPNTASIDSLAANQIVTETFALFVSDGSLQSTQNFSIQISGANDVGSSSGNNQPTNTNTSKDTTTDQTINIDGLSKTDSQLISNNENSSFLVTGESGLWVQLEVLSANSDWQNSLQIINDDGYAIGSIGATGHSTNMGNNEIFVSGGSTIRFQQSSNNQKLNQSPNLRFSPKSDNSFMLYLEDSDNQNAEYNDLSIKITTSQQPQNINAFKLSSEQYHINDSILNLTDLNPGTTKLRLTLESDCGDTNHIAFVKLTGDHANGFTVGGVASTDENAFEAAIRDSLINPSDTQILMEGKNTRQIEWTFDQSEEGFYSPVFINQRTNNLATYGITNAGDRQNLIKNLGSNFFGYEDTPSAQYSDWDFNDITMLVELF